MKKLIIYSLLLVTFVTVSCKKEASLQSYLVDSQNKKGFVTLDIPASILQLSIDKASEEDKKAFESIRKVNITGLPFENTDQTTYETEKEKLKEILKNSEYKKLMNFKKDDTNAIIYYSGETDAIDEIIAFGYSNKMGVGVARVIGENMNLNNIMKMMQNTKIDGSNLDLNQFKNLFGKTTISTAKK